MGKREYLIILYDFYGNLFNETQKTYFEEYYFNNLSLGEISENYNISRNAIHKTLKQMQEKLLYYEDNLNLYHKYMDLKSIVEKISDIDIQNKLKDLF